MSTKKKLSAGKQKVKPKFKRPLTKEEEQEYRVKRDQKQRKKYIDERNNFIDMLYKKYEN